MVLDPTVVSFAKAMQFILHGNKHPNCINEQNHNL